MKFYVNTYLNTEKKIGSVFNDKRAAQLHFQRLSEKPPFTEGNVRIALEDEKGHVYDVKHFIFSISETVKSAEVPGMRLESETETVGETVTVSHSVEVDETPVTVEATSDASSFDQETRKSGKTGKKRKKAVSDGE